MAYIGNVSGFDDVDAEQIKDGAVSDVKISDVDHSKVTGLGAEISTAVSNLVDSSPESLNTLNELAAALGDDASFSTTVTNSIATKLPLAGGTMTGDTLHGDNVKATYGAGGDLEIYHDGSHSRIADRGTGDLRIYGDSLQLNSWTSGENYLTGETDGAVTAYHNGAAKLATTSTGIDVTGVVTADGLTLGDNEKAKFGTGDDLEIYHDGSNSVITDVGVGNLEIRAANIRIKNPSQTKSYLNGNDGGAITIFHDGAQKLATTATGIDVTGTVTADGLTVDGASSINNHLTLGNAYSLGWGDFNERISGNNAGYLNFFTNALERMRIDSSGNVGIGTSTPSTYGVDGAEDLVIGQADGNHGITISSWNASNGTLAFTDTTNATVGRGYLDYDHAVNAMTVGTNGTERMRIDASGNVLVGKTSADFGATAGVEFRGDGRVATGRAGESLILNRITSDGDIALFRKDGTTVGSIGSRWGNGIYINSGGAGDGVLQNNGAESYGWNASYLYPRADAAKDLGLPALRFKDAYLSGGVHLGGTGAANKLDDYEEGTWTPSTAGATTTGVGTYPTYRKGYYTKVGNMVTLFCIVGTSDHTGGGSMHVTGLPFVATNSTKFFTSVNFGEYTLGVPTGTRLTGTITPSVNYIALQYVTNGSANSLVSALPLDVSFAYLIFSATYQTDS